MHNDLMTPRHKKTLRIIQYFLKNSISLSGLNDKNEKIHKSEVSFKKT